MDRIGIAMGFMSPAMRGPRTSSQEDYLKRREQEAKRRRRKWEKDQEARKALSETLERLEAQGLFKPKDQ